MNKILTIVLSFTALLLTACGQTNTEKEKTATTDHTAHTTEMASNNSTKFQKGDIVPSDEVCMANNAYMAKKQIVVPFEGKTYYGCCENCKKQIPKDAAVRVATDPVSKKEVDKALAVIAITGDNGEVTYFENKENAVQFLKN